MGDRALVQFYDANEVSPVIYLHWDGDSVAERLKELAEYSAARFVGICHMKDPGNLSLGIWNKESKLEAEDSHGDAGCFLVECNVRGFAVETFGGYGFEGSNPKLFEQGEGHYGFTANP